MESYEELSRAIIKLVLIFTGGFLMTKQPTIANGGSAFGAGLWLTLLGVLMDLEVAQEHLTDIKEKL